MAIALKLGTSGNLERFGSADALDINVISARTTTADITIGANLGSGQKVSIGNATADTEVLRDLLLARNVLPGAGDSALGTGVTQYFTQGWFAKVGTNGPNLDAYNLNATGTNSGAYAIGIDASLLSNATATDLMTVLDQLDAAITSNGTINETLPIENAATIAVGNCVAASSTTVGRITNAVAGANANGRFLGVCVSVTGGGIGNAGGTTTATFTKVGNRVTVSGQTYAAGGALFIPAVAGPPTQTAPSTTGDLVQRVGYAHSTTDFMIIPGPSVVL
jgi:hypothetical protein